MDGMKSDGTGRPRVLLIAEAANPDWTSVPLVGWSHAMALREEVDAHVVTQARNREAFLKHGLVEGRDFTALDSEPIARPLWQATAFVRKLTGLGWTFETAMGALPYYYFEHLFWRRFGAEIQAGRWNIVHRVTPLSPTLPSIIGARCAPHAHFVWGPINGGVPWPEGFSEVQRKEGEWLHHVRNAYRLMPGYRSTRRHASAIIAGSIATYEQMPAWAQERTVYIPENAIDPDRFAPSLVERARSGGGRQPLKVAFVGRLVPYKGADILIEAAEPLLRRGDLLLDIIGDGPERESLRQLVAQRGCESTVRIDGWVQHTELAARLVKSDVFGFPSVREFGGGVVLEAMALGLVPIVVDYGGPAELVTEETGFRVPIGPRAQLIREMRRVLESLVEDPARVASMGQCARQRVIEHFTWAEKARQVHEVYRWVLGEREKPHWGMPFEDSARAEARRARA